MRLRGIAQQRLDRRVGEDLGRWDSGVTEEVLDREVTSAGTREWPFVTEDKHGDRRYAEVEVLAPERHGPGVGASW